jgi:citrate lyase synthetase
MDNLKDINDFLTEKKVTVKRRYTESHPAKNVSTSARVRSSIIEAIADGHITEAEMAKILTELKAHKRWLNRNKTLFNISEDQEGVKTFSLSPYGQRVMNATKTTIINEALTVPHKEQGKKPVNIFVGRFQPFTLGHVKVFEKMYKENGYPVVVYLVRGKKPDPEKRPFDEDLQQAMFAKMKKQYPFLEASYVVPNGAIDTLYSAARPAYEPMLWGYGTDRKKAYNGMIDKQAYRDQLGVHPEFKGFEIKRGEENISASKVRNALKIDDEKTFKQMTPRSIHSFYKTLQNTLSPIKENKNTMKNLKSVNEYGPLSGSKNRNYTTRELVDRIGVLDDILIDNRKTEDAWERRSDEYLTGEKGREYWNDLDDHELQSAIDDAEGLLKKYNIKENNNTMKNLKSINDFGITESSSINEEKETLETVTSDLENFENRLKTYKSKNGNSTHPWDPQLKMKDYVDFLKDGIKRLEKRKDQLSESTVNEEYVESMDSIEIANALGKIETLWKDWRKGPMTEPSDIKPAQKELKGWIDRWFKQTIK